MTKQLTYKSLTLSPQLNRPSTNLRMSRRSVDFMNDAPTILLIEHEPNLAHLFASTLEDEGFRVETVVRPDDPIHEVRVRRPGLLLLDLLPPEEEALELLDALRVDDITRGIPVVVITTMHGLADTALASYNVHEVLTKPFDLDAFIEAARAHVGERTLAGGVEEPRPIGGDFLDYAERVLRTRTRQIMFRWMQRIRREGSPWRNIETHDLIDHAPRVLELIDVRLYYSSDEELFAHHPDALDRAAAHARHRQRQGIGLTPVTEEYVILRDELWRELEAGASEEVPAGFYQGERAINSTIDAVLLATLRIYQEREEDT